MVINGILRDGATNMNRKWLSLSTLFAASFVFVNLQAMEPTQPMDLEPLEPMEIYQPPAVETQPVQPAAQQGAPVQLFHPAGSLEGEAFQQTTVQDLIQPYMIDQIARNWMQRPNYFHNLVHELGTAYGPQVGQAVAKRIREIIAATSIILVNNSGRAATVTIEILNRKIQAGLSSQERRVLELPQNLWSGLVMGMWMHITASLDVPPSKKPRSFGVVATVTGGARIIITGTGMTVRNISEPTLPPLRRQRARRNLFGLE